MQTPLLEWSNYLSVLYSDSQCNSVLKIVSQNGQNERIVEKKISQKFRFVVSYVVDELYFVVQSVNEPTLRRVTSLLDPTIFPAGTYKSLR